MMKLIWMFGFCLFFVSAIAQISPATQEKKILIVLSNQGFYGTSDIRTANHFEETVVPYDQFVKAGYDVDFVSPSGGEVPIGYINTSVPIMSKYIFDHAFMDKLHDTKDPAEIDATDYVAIFYSGGGAAMFGVPENERLQDIAVQIYEKQNGVVSAICHGAGALANLKTSDGKYLIAGRQVNGFPDLFENTNAEYYKQFPFSIETILQERGAKYSYSKEGWDGYYIVDGRIITGQDPSSAKEVANAIIQELAKQNY